ncbi:TPA: phage tail spike protein [Streptococcus suis]
MLYLLDKDTKIVKWNGIPLHEVGSATVKEETNGDFYLTVSYPITDSGIYQLIKEDMLIKAPVPVLGAQLFRIKKPVENDDSLDITAYHVSDDIMKRSITPMSVVRQGCAMALSQMVQNAKTDLGDFSFTSDITDRHTFNTDENATLYTILLDGKHSIVGTWEGELVRDNLAFTVKKNRGENRGVVITTHKNLKSYQRTKNSQSVVTRIHAKSTFKAEGAETDTVLTVTVDSPLIGNYPYINEKEYENNDAKTVEELRKWAEAKFANEGIDKVSDAIEIEAYELDGQVVNLGDTVNLKSWKHNIDVYKKAVSYEFDALTEKYISITFDDKPGVGGSGVSSGVANAADVILSANQNAQEVAIERAVKNANQAFDAEFEKQKTNLLDSIEQSKAEAELYADNIKQSIDADINAVNTSMHAQSEEHDRQVADILTNAQSIETLANQAKTDAASAMARANQVKTEAIADATAQVATAIQALNTAKTDLQNQVNAVDAKAEQAQTDIDLQAQALNNAKTDLQNQVNAVDAKAQTLTADLANSKNDILAQANAQTALTSRVTTVETTANGTKETVTQLSKTVNDLDGEVASATQSIKTVEDSIDGVYTTLSKIQVGGANLLNRTRDLYYNGYKANNTSETYQGFTVASGATTGSVHVDIYNQKTNTVADKADYFLTFYAKGTVSGQTIDCFFYNTTPTTRAESSQGTVTSSSDGKITITLTTTWQRYWIKWTQTAGTTAKEVLIGRNYSTNRAYVTMPALFEGNTIRDWAGSLQDSSMEFAEYKQTIDGQLTSLINSYQTLNGQVSQNTVKIETTANSINEDLTSLQSYVDNEGTRRTEYLTTSELKTAELIAAERTKVARDYVAKSTYDEDVRGTTLKLNEVKTTADTAKQNLATYQNTVDRKLSELTTSTQTLDGKINTASAKVDTVAGQIRTEISTVEGKIPKSVGGRNLAQKTSADWSTPYTNFSGKTNTAFTLYKVLIDDLAVGDTLKSRIVLKHTNVVPASGQTAKIRLQGSGDVTDWSVGRYNSSPEKTIRGSGEIIFEHEFKITADHLKNKYWDWQVRTDYIASGSLQWKLAKVEKGDVFTDWSLAPKDLIDEISSVKTTITQTASGVEQLTTSLATTDGKVTTAETKINQLIGDVSSKVSQTDFDAEKTKISNLQTSVTQQAGQIALKASQTDYNTLTGRVNSAETAITQNATEISKRLTSTQVESAITGKGYQTKSQVDSNITGRGYITNSALQPYALSTTVQNLVQETADSFNRTISETKALIPSGESNLVNWGRPGETSEYVNAEIITHSFFYGGGIKLYFIRNTSATNEKTVSFNRFAVERNTDYTLYFKGFNTSALVGMDVWFLKRVRGSTAIFDNAQLLVDNRKLSTSKCDEVVVTFNTGNFDEGFIRFDNNKSVVEGISAELYFGDVSVKKGKSNNGWSPSVEELATVTALNAVKTTITQTSQGVEQLSTSLSTTNGKITTAETKISQLISDVSSKVSQTDYNTLTGRVSSAETAITQNATEISKRLTSTQVESAITGKGYQTASQVNTAITGKGYQTKGDVDSNITGRGYITNGALQPYALTTTVQNLVKETADSFSRTISETKALIPSEAGGRNYILESQAEIVSAGGWVNKTFNLSSDLLSNLSKIKTVTISCEVVGENVSVYNSKKRFGLSWSVEIDGIVNYWEVWQTEDTTKKRISQTFTVPDGKVITKLYDPQLWIQASGNIKVSNPKIEYGTLATDYTVALEDLATVTALNNVTDTVDSHTRTIGAVGTTGSILDNVSKVTQTANGLVTEVSGTNGLKTQVSTLAGSYAIKNLTNSGTVLNQLNLNKDGSVRIDGKLVQITGTTYIQDGVISSAKIGSLDAGKITTGTLDAARIATNSITGSHILFDQAFFNSFTANEAYLKQVFAQNAFITSVQSTNISANLISGGVLKSTNGATNFDLNNGNLLFNNNYGYIRRTANDKIFEITTLLTEKNNDSAEYLSSKFMIRKSDSSRRSGVSFNLYTTLEGKPAATTQIYSDSFTITSSDNTILFSLTSKKSYLGTLNFHGWDDIPVASISGGLVVNDIGIRGHGESLLKVLERLCAKTGIIWV